MNHLQLRCIPDDVVYVAKTQWWDLMGARAIYDGVVHVVALMNRGDEPVRVSAARCEALAGDETIALSALSEDQIKELLPPLIGRDQIGLRRLLDLILWLGEAVGDTPLAQGLLVGPGETLVIPNLFLASSRLPETYLVSVDVEAPNGERETISRRIPASQYESANRYHVPVRGRWFMKSMPRAGLLDHHRFGAATEFGVDFLKLGSEGAIYAGSGDQMTDYYSMGEDVLATADGRVIALQDALPQTRDRFFPRSDESDEAFQVRQLEEVRQALDGDIPAWAAGNYILMEHAGGEISAYLHLQQGSVAVAVGDDVTQGATIAKVGNTGDSFGAHLHFHVMDRPDLLTGRSLPFSFEDLEPELEEPGMIVAGSGRGT